ncbi:MAG: DUF3962 domain-containing protein [Anaerolineae bacterium]|jgi:hypothetical protein|nr:DUF3962 domain-containing protein [Anaerolineae bacterium]
MKQMRMARARITHNALNDVLVSVMDFPYVEALDVFVATMLECKPNRKKRKNPIEKWEVPPFRRLNGALIATAPTLIHGFEEYSASNKQWEKSGIWQKSRRALALIQTQQGQELWCPNVTELNDLVWVWAKQWATATFPNEISTETGNLALKNLLHSIQINEEGWSPPLAASHLWAEHQKEGYVYKALPSIISALVVEKSRLQPLLMGDDNKPIVWRLAQDGDHGLAIVSEPFSHNKGDDLLSYKLEFSLQTQPSHTEPWLAVFIRLSRWGSRKVASTNFKRKVTVMVRLGSERKKGWKIGTDPTMVRLQVDGSVKKKGLKWRDKVSELLSEWRARNLVDANDVFANPLQHSPAPDGDHYLVLHAEGMTYKGGKHSAKSGTSLRERVEITKYLEELLTGVLQFDEPLDVDMPVSLNAAELADKKLLALYTYEDMKKVQVKSPRKKIKHDRKQLKRERVDAAFERARQDRMINLLLITVEDKPVLERVVREILLLEESDSLPDYLTIKPVALPLDLALPFGNSIPNVYERKYSDRDKHQAALTAEWEAKRDSWEAFLKPYVVQNAVNLALIELPGNSANITERDDWLKSAVRHACVKCGIISQMVFSFPQKLYSYPYTTKDLPRVRNAAADLLIRQPHVLYDVPSTVYRFAGLTDERADQLVLGGLFRHRKLMQAKIDYPVYVELHPNGEVWVTLPDTSGSPQKPIPYVDANIALGRLFCEPITENTKWNLNYRKDHKDGRLAHFVTKILKSRCEQPTLIFLEADGWRQEGIYLTGNGNVNRNSLRIGDKVFMPTDLPNIFLLRVRDAGTLNETPQYIETNAWDQEQFDRDDRMVGIIDKHGKELFHYFSIGRQSPQDHTLYAFDDGGDKAFRHQQAIEFIPFFGVKTEDDQIFCRIAHLLRSTPAWTRGSITLPFVLHLAMKLIDDALDVLRPTLYIE